MLGARVIFCTCKYQNISLLNTKLFRFWWKILYKCCQTDQRKKMHYWIAKFFPVHRNRVEKSYPSCNASSKSLLIPWLSDHLCERQKCGRKWWSGSFGHYLQFGWCLEMPCGLRAGEKILDVLWINVNCGHKFECCFFDVKVAASL